MKRPKKISKKEHEKMERVAMRREWRGLIRLEDVPAFARWLTDDWHEWMGQSPDEGEDLRVHKPGITRTVIWEVRRTSCGRYMMLLWYTFCCFRDG